MGRGCTVLGAASMGAIRAAELHEFGMVGIGAIFEDFVAGRITRDDEVAIEHGPAELGYPVLSEALVNIRYSLARAVAEGALAAELSAELVDIAAQTFYPKRSLEHAISAFNALAREGSRIEPKQARSILGHAVDRKMLDALSLIDAIKSGVVVSPRPTFELQETAFFADFVAAMNNPLIRDFG